MNHRYLTLLTTLAFLGFSSSALIAKQKCDEWPNCPNPNPEPEPGVVYTAELTDGDFVFASGTTDPLILEGLTANRKGTALSGPDTDELWMDISGSNKAAWDYIFNPDPDPSRDCLQLVTEGSITSFNVAPGNWGISHIGAKGAPGHVYIVMRNLEIIIGPLLDEYSNAQFDFDLHGDVVLKKDGTFDLFPPEACGNPSTFNLNEYVLWGGIGGQYKIVCSSGGRLPLTPPTTLEISASSID
jgi:hypothetical protein